MRRSALRPLLLLLALFMGQWLGIAHAAQHPALAADLPCPVCVHGQGLDSAGLAAPPALPDFRGATAPVQPAAVAAVYRPLPRCSIRGPPHVLA